MQEISKKHRNCQTAHFRTADDMLRDAEQKKQLDLLNLVFRQSLAGIFFMMLDEPVVWNDTVDKERALDYIFDHMRITKANPSALAMYRADEQDFIGQTPSHFFHHDLEQGRQVIKQLFDA